MGPGILQRILQSYPSVYAWALAAKWHNYRNEREGLTLAVVLDHCVALNLSPSLRFMDILLRRLGALHVADAQGAWDTAVQLEAVPEVNTPLFEATVLQQAKKLANVRNKLAKPATAATATKAASKGV